MSRATFGEGGLVDGERGAPTADGGQAAPDVGEVDHGTIVIDREDDDPDPAVVVNCPPVPAAEWIAYTDDGEEVTVADDNPEYDAEAEVVVVAFRDDLGEVRPDWNGEQALALSDLTDETSVYAFPPRRLEPIGEVGTTLKDTPPDAGQAKPVEEHREVPDKIEALAERLRGGATVEVGFRGETPTLSVEKLGSTYVIEPDATVEGDGPHAERLAEVAAEYLGGEGR